MGSFAVKQRIVDDIDSRFDAAARRTHGREQFTARYLIVSFRETSLGLSGSRSTLEYASPKLTLLGLSIIFPFKNGRSVPYHYALPSAREESASRYFLILFSHKSIRYTLFPDLTRSMSFKHTPCKQDESSF